MTRPSYALLGLDDWERPSVLMLLDDQHEANAIAAELRKGGANVGIRFLPTGAFNDDRIDVGNFAE